MEWKVDVVDFIASSSYVNIGYDPVNTLWAIRQTWKDSLRCDVVIFGKGRQVGIPCPSVLLVAISGYFRALLDGRWTSSPTETRRIIHLDEIPNHVINQLLEISLTGHASIEMSSVIELIAGAAYLEMDAVQKKLCDLIREESGYSTLLWFYMHPEVHNDVPLYRKGKAHVLRCFDDIMEACADEMMKLTKDQWVELLSSKQLFSLNENAIFEVVEKWVAHDIGNRSGHFFRIAKHLRPSLLDSTEIAENWEDQPPILQGFISAVQSISSSSTTEPKYSKRRTEAAIEVILVVGRHKSDHGTAAEFGLVHPLLPIPENSLIPSAEGRSYDAGLVTSPDNMVYVVGQKTWRYDAFNDSWKQLSRKREKVKFCAGIGYLDGYIYVIRGWTAAEMQNKIECVDAETGIEKEIPLMPETVSWKHVCLLGHSSKLYVFFTDKYVTFDPKTGLWSGVEVLPTDRRSRTGCAGPDGMIYLAGTAPLMDEYPREIGLDKYDPVENKWTSCRPAKVHRRTPTLVCVSGKVMLVGGLNWNETDYNKIEIYDEKTDSWSMKECILPVTRGYMTATSVKVPPSIKRDMDFDDSDH